MIPGKRYKPEDFLEGAWRRRWFIVIPLVVITAVTMVVVQRLPDRYESSATMLIVPQRIPEAYVRSTITTRLDERLLAIGQEILSRTRLESIVQEFNLYPEERRTMIMEDIIEMMRTRDINFNTSRARADSGSFEISFQYSSARTAQAVASRLASLFIQENVQDRAVLAEQTDEFLGSQLLEVERQLKEREKQLEDFRRAHPGGDADAGGIQPAGAAERAAPAPGGAGVDHTGPGSPGERAASARRPGDGGGDRAAPRRRHAAAGAADLRTAARVGARGHEEPADEADGRPSGHQGPESHDQGAGTESGARGVAGTGIGDGHWRFAGRVEPRLARVGAPARGGHAAAPHRAAPGRGAAAPGHDVARCGRASRPRPASSRS